jgi:hypothetical protein
MWHGERYDVRQETVLPWDDAAISDYPSKYIPVSQNYEKTIVILRHVRTWMPVKLMKPLVGALYPAVNVDYQLYFPV